MITTLSDLHRDLNDEANRLRKKGYVFHGPLKKLGKALDALQYTVAYLEFVADHAQDDKTLADFLGVPRDEMVLAPARNVFRRLLSRHSQTDIDAAMAQLRSIRAKYLADPKAKPQRSYQYKKVRPSLAQRLAA